MLRSSVHPSAAGRSTHVKYAGIGEADVDSAVAYNHDVYRDEDDDGGDFDLVEDEDDEPAVMDNDDISKVTAPRQHNIDVSRIPTIRAPGAGLWRAGHGHKGD